MDNEAQSGQKINKEMSAFYIYNKVAQTDINRVEEYTGFYKGKFPLTYLGCPVGYAKKRKSYFLGLIKKVQSKMHAWKGKLLSYGGKIVLINSIL